MTVWVNREHNAPLFGRLPDCIALVDVAPESKATPQKQARHMHASSLLKSGPQYTFVWPIT